jgi:hypothetical protein
VLTSFRLVVPRKSIPRCTNQSHIFDCLFTSRLYRRQLSAVTLRVEIRGDPVYNISGNATNQTAQIQNIISQIINLYQSGELQTIWAASAVTGYTAPLALSVQEPLSQTTVPLSVIASIALVTPPASCREQSPCTTQPILVAYDSNGNVIQKLGSINNPWQITASVVGQPNVALVGANASYSNGQTQYTSFGLPDMGTYQVQFSFIQPDGVSR